MYLNEFLFSGRNVFSCKVELDGADPVRPRQRARQRHSSLHRADDVLLTSGRQPTGQLPASAVPSRAADVAADRVNDSSAALGSAAGVDADLPTAGHRRRGVWQRPFGNLLSNYRSAIGK